MTDYKQAKQNLLQFSKQVKRDYKTDKTAIRTAINMYCDSLLRDLNRTASEKKARQNELNLSSFAASLHPKH